MNTKTKQYIPALTDKVAKRFPSSKWENDIVPNINSMKQTVGVLLTPRSKNAQDLLSVVCGKDASVLELARLRKAFSLDKFPTVGRGYLFSGLVFHLASENGVLVSLKSVMRAYRKFFGVRVHGDYPIMVANYGNHYVIDDADIKLPDFSEEKNSLDEEKLQKGASAVIGLLQRMSDPNKYSGEEMPTYTTDDKCDAPTGFGSDKRFVGGTDSRDKYKQKKNPPTLSSVLRENGKLDEAEPKEKPPRRSILRDLLVELEEEKEEETEFIGANDKEIEALRQKHLLERVDKDIEDGSQKNSASSKEKARIRQIEEDERKLTEALGLMEETVESVEPPKIIPNPRTGGYSVNPEHPAFSRIIAMTPKNWKRGSKVAQSLEEFDKENRNKEPLIMEAVFKFAEEEKLLDGLMKALSKSTVDTDLNLSILFFKSHSMMYPLFVHLRAKGYQM